jgi:Spy/CpxP family protein refolding chaperone
MVIFGCGVVTGGLLMKTVLPPASVPAEMTPRPGNSTNQPPALGQFQRPEFLRRMQKQLDLTASETDAITKMVKESQERTRPLWDQIAPALHDEMKRLRQEIRQTLTPEQQKKFDGMLKSRPRKPEGAGAAAGRSTRPPDSPAQTNTP